MFIYIDFIIGWTHHCFMTYAFVTTEAAARGGVFSLKAYPKDIPEFMIEGQCEPWTHGKAKTLRIIERPYYDLHSQYRAMAAMHVAFLLKWI